ncbi:MAG TPA: hypothetical protein VGN57_21820 [Pirellulaceae bacterium]|jgi:hypothetical protein|nr:hypothetical protein [Pirellulaceae bacterium]
MERVSRTLLLRSHDLAEAPHVDGALPDWMAFLYRDEEGVQVAPHYFRRDVRQLGSVQAMLFDDRPHADWKLDMCLGFAPNYFAGAKLLRSVERAFRNVAVIDFREGAAELPEIWREFREECRPRMQSVEIVDLARREAIERVRPDAERPMRGAARFAQRLFSGDPKFGRTTMNRSSDPRRSRAVPACD